MNVRSGRREVTAPRIGVAIIGSAGTATRRIASILEREGLGVVRRVTTANDLATGGVSAPYDVCVAVQGRRNNVHSDWLANLSENLFGVPLVVITACASRREIRDALASGASGLVVEGRLENQLVPTVRAVFAGQLALPAEFLGALVKPRLSPREKQILAMVVMGFANREIAGKLFITEATVKSHLSSAFQKLGVRSRTAAAELILDPDGGLGTGILAISDGRG